MELVRETPTIKLSGIINAYNWNKSGSIRGLSIVASDGKEYRILPTKKASNLAHFVWDEVELEGHFEYRSKGRPWFEVRHYHVNEEWPATTYGLEGDSMDEDWRFDVDRHLDRMQNLPYAEWEEDIPPPKKRIRKPKVQKTPKHFAIAA